jgi:hypothetical protein
MSRFISAVAVAVGLLELDADGLMLPLSLLVVIDIRVVFPPPLLFEERPDKADDGDF